MARAFLQYDVFTGEPLLGNQLAVFTDAAGLTADQMQRIAREMNFAESTFILPAEWAGTDIRMRIFTPATEMPMAGHPTIGSTFALAETGVIAPGTPRVIFHLNVGPTPVDLEWQDGRLVFAWMTQANPTFGPVVEARPLVAEALGLAASDLVAGAPIQQVSCGVPFLLVPLRDAPTVDRAVSDAAAFRRLVQVTGVSLPIFLFAMDDRPWDEAGEPRPRGAGTAPRSLQASLAPLAAPAMVYSRMFAPEFGVTEDPATGSASGPLGCYLVQHGVVTPDAGRWLISRQGVAMHRASRIHISIGTMDNGVARSAVVINDVRVGGEAVLVARGELLV